MALELLSVGADGRQLQRIAGGPAGEKKVATGAPVPFAPDGSGLREVPGTSDATHPVFSPDGHTLAFGRSRERHSQINTHNPIPSLLHGRSYQSTTTWLLDLQSGQERRLTPWRNGLDIEPSSFSPDEALLAVSRSFRGSNEVATVSLGTGATTVLAHDAEDPAYSPDGSRLTHTRYRQEASPSWDPSGARLAYTQTTAPEPLASGFGLTNVAMEINAEGSCPTRLIGRPRAGRLPKPLGPGLYGPTWQPGPGREAGAIQC
jgi:Tol biopolymer transport system component